MPDAGLYQALEERLVNVWPAVDTLFMDGWVLRFANGYSSRANSASALVMNAALAPALLERIEGLYRAAALTPCVRVTPVCHPDVAPTLLSRGWRIKDRSLTMVLDLADWRGRTPDSRVTLERAASRAWAQGVGAVQAPEKRNADHLLAIVGRIRVPAAFATLTDEARMVGFGMCAIDRGYAEIGSIVVDEARRGQGIGRKVVEALLAFAAMEGASHAFLQVDATNALALGLYRSQGFVDIGPYQNMLAPDVTGAA
jgi:N-acetylglutamate synthase